MGCLPGRVAGFLAEDTPVIETLEGSPEAQSILATDKIDEGIAKSVARGEVQGQIEQIVKTLEASVIQQAQQLIPSVGNWGVPNHDRSLKSWILIAGV